MSAFKRLCLKWILADTKKGMQIYHKNRKELGLI